MKRIKLLLPLMSLVLSGCIFDHWGSSGLGEIEAKYVLNSGEESNQSLHIRYGESFNIKEFKVYYTTKSKTALLKESEYTVRLSEGNKDSLLSDRPEIGQYYVLFEYKTKTSSLAFTVNKATEFIEDTARLEIDDTEFGALTQKPLLLGCIDSEYYNWSFNTYRLNDDGTEGEQWSYPYYEVSGEPSQTLMNLMPGRYKLKATFSTEHYYDVHLETTFSVAKIAFPSDRYYVQNSFQYSKYQPGYDQIGSYTLNEHPVVIDRESGRETTESWHSTITLEYKNPEASISTTEERTYKVILHCPYFFDYEYDITVNLGKNEVEKPSNFYIPGTSNDWVFYDGEEHEVKYHWISGDWYLDENSVIKATNPGHYEIRFKLAHPEHDVWKGTSSSEDFVYEWDIKKGSWTKTLSAYEFRINGRVLTPGQDTTPNTFVASEFLGEIKLYIKYKGEDEFVEYNNFTLQKDASWEGCVILDGNVVTEINITHEISFAISYVVTHDFFEIQHYWWIKLTVS